MHDVLVVGGGIAGLRAAVAAKGAGASVALLTQSHPTRSYSVTVQDGINAPDSAEGCDGHINDTLAAGAGLNVASVVTSICREAAALVEELDRLGVPFNRVGSVIDRAPVSGAGESRATYVNDITGLAVTQTLYEQVIGTGVDVYEEWLALSLVVDGGECVGVVALQLATGALEAFDAKAVVLATGGLRRAFEPSTSSLHCSGSGIALAYRAGASLVDMEFVQYYPAVLSGSHLALSPLLLGAGAVLEDGSVRLNGTLDSALVEARFPDTLHRVEALSGVNMLTEPAPVQSGMSRLLGGVDVNVHGESSIPGLFAAGECAGNGFHGAQGLNGNFLLVSAASGRSAGLAAAAHMRSVAEGTAGAQAASGVRAELDAALARPGGAPVSALRTELASLMHQKAGESRDAEGLSEAVQRIRAMREEHAQLGAGSTARDFNFGLVQYLEAGTLLDVAETIAASALERTESRGVHRRTDHPEVDASQGARQQVTRSEDGARVSRETGAA
ncbi:MAG: FAD-binding protein [Chloroflexota bacterium]|nr:FAD-binding protein [Chloroflexota bacterium]MDE2886022.1 FAD-binding protein [Chloroflexota bacterium]